MAFGIDIELSAVFQNKFKTTGCGLRAKIGSQCSRCGGTNAPQLKFKQKC